MPRTSMTKTSWAEWRLSWRCLGIVLAVACAATGADARPLRKTPPVPAAAPAQGTLRVGRLDLVPCGPAWCGTLDRAFDPAGEVPGTITIGFEFYPQRDPSRPNAGTVVAS